MGLPIFPVNLASFLCSFKTSYNNFEVVDLMNEHVHRYNKKEDDFNIEELNSIFDDLEIKATETLTEENVPETRQLLKRNIRMQYENESNEIDIEVPSGFISKVSIKEILQKFHLIAPPFCRPVCK